MLVKEEQKLNRRSLWYSHPSVRYLAVAVADERAVMNHGEMIERSPSSFESSKHR
jgi:hypothetical protein